MENSKSNQNKEDFDEINEEQTNNKALITFVHFNKYTLNIYLYYFKIIYNKIFFIKNI